MGRDVTQLLLASIAVLLLFVTGCGKMSTSGNVTPATGPTTEEAFLEQFRAAYSSKDLDRIMACWCWDGNTEEDLAPVRDQVAADLELTVKEIRIEPLNGDEITQFTLRGVTYVTNLNPIARVVV